MRPIFTDGGIHQKEAPGLVGARPPYPLLADRPDVLVFQTGPLPADVELTGPIEVNLWISSSAVDTDFHREAVGCLSAQRGLPRRLPPEPGRLPSSGPGTETASKAPR